MENDNGQGGFVVNIYSSGNQIIKEQTNNYYGTVYQQAKPKDLTEAEDMANAEETEDTEGDSGADLVEKLKPIFYNNEDDARLFLKEIAGMQPNNITDLVNMWVKDQRISNYGNSRKGVFWEILYDAGLYTKSRQNWCRRVY